MLFMLTGEEKNDNGYVPAPNLRIEFVQDALSPLTPILTADRSKVAHGRIHTANSSYSYVQRYGRPLEGLHIVVDLQLSKVLPLA